MNSDQIFGVLQEISVLGTNDKVDVLKEMLEDEDFAEVVNLAYNPLITFNVLNATMSKTGNKLFTDQTFQLLLRLSSRSVTGNAAREELFEKMKPT